MFLQIHRSLVVHWQVGFSPMSIHAGEIVVDFESAQQPQLTKTKRRDFR